MAIAPLTPEQETDDLETLLPESTIKNSVGAFEVFPIKLKQLKHFTGIVKKYKALFLGAEGETVDVGAKIAALLIDDYEAMEADIKAILALTSQVNPDQVDEMTVPEIVELVMAGLSQNMNFFVQALNKGAARLGGSLKTTGN